jgi:phosphate transport system substrate-binding protein
MSKIYKRLVLLMLFLVLSMSLLSCKREKPSVKNPVNSELPKTTIETAAPNSEVKNQPDASKDKGLSFTKADFQRVDGSTATIPLSEAVAAELLSMKPEEVQRFISHSRTHYAYERLFKNEVDIIFVTEPSEEELKLAKINNIEIEVIPVVKDAFVFLVNKKNKIESLTMKQIVDIYSGKLTNWKDVGGSDGKILAYQRPLNSGSQTLMLNMVMKGTPMVTPEKHMEPAGMGDLIEVVAGYDNSELALGYSVYYYANTMYLRDTVKLIGVDGVKPDSESLKAGRYPLTSAYYAVLRKNEPENSFARILLKWVLSEQGQKIAEKAGYIPLK